MTDLASIAFTTSTPSARADVAGTNQAHEWRVAHADRLDAVLPYGVNVSHMSDSRGGALRLMVTLDLTASYGVEWVAMRLRDGGLKVRQHRGHIVITDRESAAPRVAA
jgi:hypothetical protein